MALCSESTGRMGTFIFLERGTENNIERTTLSQSLPVFIQQSYRPSDKSSVEKTLELIGKLGSRMPLYRLKCNMLPEAAFTAYKTLSTDAGHKKI